MKTSGHRFSLPIEPLESRIAPAAITFTQADGDVIRIFASKGTRADLIAAADIADGELLRLNLAGNPVFADANITISVISDVLETNSDGLADVGFINARGLDLGVVRVIGDLGRIKVGDADSTDGSCSLLSARTMGLRGGDTQVAGGDLRSAFIGKLGALNVTGSIREASILVSGGVFDLDGQIGSIEIGDSLIANTGGSGVIYAKGPIGSVHVRNDILGGAQESSGSIISERTIGSVTIGGNIDGGAGFRSGRIFAADVLGSVKIGGFVRGGSGDESGSIASFIGINDVTFTGLFSDALMGGSGNSSGVIGSGGFIKSVVMNDGGIMSGSGARSGAILAKGDIGFVKVDSIRALDGDNAGAISGVIAAGGVIQSIRVDGDITGGGGFESGAVGSRGGIGKIVVTGSVTGGDGAKSGAILSRTDIDTVVIRGSITGGNGDDSGIIGATGFLDTAFIAGSITGGQGPRSGVVGSLGGIGSVHVSEDIKGAEGANSGAIASQGVIQDVTVEGSLLGGSGYQSGAIGSTRRIHSVTVDGDLEGYVTPPNPPPGGGGGGPGERSAVILSAGNIDLVHIGGSLAGGEGLKSGSVVSFGTIGLVEIDHDLIGGAGTDSGSVSGENIVTDTGATGGAIRRVIVHGKVQGGFGENSGTVQSSEDLGTVTVDGDLNGGRGEFSGSIISAGKIGTVAIGGSVNGGGGRSSGIIETDGELEAGNMGTVTVAGFLQGGSGENSGTIFSSGNLGNVTIGHVTGEATVGGIAAGNGYFSGGIGAALNAGRIVINGSVVSGATDETGKISIGGDLASLIVRGNVSGNDGNFNTTGNGSEQLGQIFVNGILNTLTITGDLIGGDGAYSGQVRSAGINRATINGNIVGGAGDQSGALVAAVGDLATVDIVGQLLGGSGQQAGLIAAARSIGTLNIRGVNTVASGSPDHATISAGGRLNPATNTLAIAIGAINVTETVDNLDILAGYHIDGAPVNPDAQIGIVKIGKTLNNSVTALRDSNIVAGVTAGANGQFGDADDVPISAATNSPRIISKIASLIINGNVSASGGFGAAAQEIASLTVAGFSFSLTPGPGNDDVDSIGKSGFSAFETGTIVL